MRDLFLQTYGRDYNFQDFYDTDWLTKLVYDDKSLIYVTEIDGRVVITASVNLSVGALDDMVAEFGRLVAASDSSVHGKGYPLAMLREMEPLITEKAQLFFGEARTAHRGSQRIADALGWAAVGYEPLKYRLGDKREGAMVYLKAFPMALELRRNHPRLIPEVRLLADAALRHLGLTPDVVVADETEGYPRDEEFSLEMLEQAGVSSLLRLPRGRITRREVFGNAFSLSHSFFMVQKSECHYLVARRNRSIVGGIGFVHDPVDQKIRILELIELNDAVLGFLLASIERIAREEFAVDYIEVDVSAYSPKIQRTLDQLGFFPAAYLPAMAFDKTERLDVVRMVKLYCPYDPGHIKLLEHCQEIRKIVDVGLSNSCGGLAVNDVIARTELFSGLPDGERTRLARICQGMDWPAGSVLATEGGPADRLYILAAGRAEVSMNGNVIAVLEPGSVFGEMGILEDLPRIADVKIVQDSKVLELELGALQRLMNDWPRLGMQVTRNLAISVSRKLRRADQRLIHASTPCEEPEACSICGAQRGRPV